MSSIKRRHSAVCPCNEHIRTQSQYYHKLLKKCGQGSKQNKYQLLKNSDPCFIRYLARCAHGVLTRSIRLPKAHYKQLGGAKKALLRLVNPKLAVSRKRQILLSQTGGAFGFIPMLIATLGASVGGELIKKYMG